MSSILELKKLEAEQAAKIVRIQKEYAEKIKAAQELRTQVMDELEALAKKFSCSSINELLTAVGLVNETATVGAAAEAVEVPARKRLSDTEKAKVVEALKGDQTANEIAKQFGVSAGTVNLIKKNAGLTKPRATT